MANELDPARLLYDRIIELEAAYNQERDRADAADVTIAALKEENDDLASEVYILKDRVAVLQEQLTEAEEARDDWEGRYLASENKEVDERSRQERSERRRFQEWNDWAKGT